MEYLPRLVQSKNTLYLNEFGENAARIHRVHSHSQEN